MTVGLATLTFGALLLYSAFRHVSITDALTGRSQGTPAGQGDFGTVDYSQSDGAASGGGGGGGGGGPTTAPAGPGLGTFGGFRVARWIIPELEYARRHGWHGNITSGYRAGYDPHAVGGHSEHSGTAYPHGAVDFGGFYPNPNPNAEAFRAATVGYTGPRLLVPVNFVDGGHMSGTGH